MRAATYELSVEERDAIFNTLSAEQKDFLNHEMIRSRRTIFAQMMAKAKGAMIPDDASYEDIEQLLDEWIYTGYIDAGEVSPDYPCDCGRALRYQHEVKHKTTGEILHFGIKHLEEHLKLDARTVSLIMKGFDVLDAEMFEILCKYREGWVLEEYLVIPEGFPFPKDIQSHLELNLPLLDRQIAKLKRKIREHIDGSKKVQEPVRLLPRLEDTNRLPGIVYDVDDQMSFSLFDGMSVSSPESIDRNTKQNYQGHEIRLDERLKPKVIDLLKSGTQSAKVVTEILVRDKTVDQRRYSSGKPHLYVPICAYIDDHLIPDGQCLLVQTSSEDRIYEWVHNG